MAKVELKKPIVDEIANTINDADSVLLVNYCGLTVEQDTELRRSLREADVIYKVYKNRMMNFAFQGTPCEALCKHLENTNALAVSKDDATAPARLLAEYSKKNPKLEFVAGVVEGAYYDADGLKQLATIPSRDELLGKLLGSIQSPIANLARVISQIAENGGEVSKDAKADDAPEAEAAAVQEAPAEEVKEEPAADAKAEEAEAQADAAEGTEEAAAESNEENADTGEEAPAE